MAFHIFRRQAAKRPVEQAKCAIGGDTLDRHLTFLGQVFDYVIARGSKELVGYRSRKLRGRTRNKNRRARGERTKLPIDRAKAIFQTTPFINCAGWDELGKGSEQGARQIFHCALYFVPILIHDTGARRRMQGDVAEVGWERTYTH